MKFGKFDFPTNWASAIAIAWAFALLVYILCSMTRVAPEVVVSAIPPGLGTITYPPQEFYRPQEPETPEVAPAMPLPDLLELSVAPVELADNGGFKSCLDFTLLDDRTQKRVLRGALNGSGDSLVGFNMCVNQHAAFAGELLVSQCRNGVSPTRAFDLALSYLKRNCRMSVDPYEDEYEESFDIFREIF